MNGLRVPNTASHSMPTPDPSRLLAGFILAPMAPAALGVLTGFLPFIPVFLCIGIYLPTLLVGVPLYLHLRRRVWPSLLKLMAAGAFAAAMPWFLFVLVTPLPNYSSSGGRVTVENGRRTLEGWVSYFEALGLMAFLGAVGGLAFWYIVVSRDPRYRRA